MVPGHAESSFECTRGKLWPDSQFQSTFPVGETDRSPRLDFREQCWWNGTIDPPCNATNSQEAKCRRSKNKAPVYLSISASLLWRDRDHLRSTLRPQLLDTADRSYKCLAEIHVQSRDPWLLGKASTSASGRTSETARSAQSYLPESANSERSAHSPKLPRSMPKSQWPILGISSRI